MEYDVDGLKLHADQYGSGEAPPVLLIHGFPVNGQMWRPICELLSADLRLIVPDLRGFGRSQAAASASMATYVDDCVALLDSIGEKRPVTVMGLSMGGYIAFEFFRRARSRLRALILTDTRGNPDGDEARKGRLQTAQRVLTDGSQVVADAMIDKAFGKSATADLKREWHAIMSGSSPHGVAAALRAMADRPDSTVTYREIDVPTLIIVGEEDVITPPEDARKMHAAIAGSTLEIIPKAGHMAPLERPRLVAEAVRHFMTKL